MSNAGTAQLAKHHVSTLSVTLMLFCLVSAGAFGIEEMIPSVGPGMTLILLIAFPLFWSNPISKLVAECSSLLPDEGGIYVWVKEAFGEFWGFQAGWWGAVACYVTNGVYVALVAGYVGQLISLSVAASITLKAGMIILFTVVNLLGFREVEHVNTVMSILIAAGFLLVVVVGLVNWQTNPFSPIVPAGGDVPTSLGDGFCLAIWFYCGYECVSTLAGEVENPQVIPRGLRFAMPLIALCYVLPTLAGLACMPEGSWVHWSLKAVPGGENIGYATVLSTYLGNAWGWGFLLIAIISNCAIFNMYIASGSRSWFVLADDHLCPKGMAKVGKKSGVPTVAIISMAIASFIMVQGDFTFLVSLEVVFMMASYILLSFATWKLRKLHPVEERIERGLYVIKSKPQLLCCVIAPVLIAGVTMLINGTDYLAAGLVGIATGPVAYLIFRRRCGGLTAVDPERYPQNERTKLAPGDTRHFARFSGIVGLFAFLGQFWLRFYEGTYGGWTPEDYVLFCNHIPLVQDILCVAGLALMVLAVVLWRISKRIED